jgi:dCMP deaminase
MPSGAEDDVCEEWVAGHERDDVPDVMRTKAEVLHAEANALMKISENGGVGAQGGTLYTVYSPCRDCAKLIKQAKITRVVFRHQYRDQGGIDFLKKYGVKVDKLENSQ